MTDGGLERVIAGGDPPQLLEQAVATVGDDSGAHRPVPAATGQRVGQIAQHQIVIGGLDPVGQPSRGVAQLVGRGGRHRENQFRGVGRLRGGSAAGRLRRLLEHGVHVRPGHAVGRDARAARSLDRPRGVLGRDEHAGLDLGQVIGQTVEVQVARDDTVVHGQHGLHQSQHAGGGFGMAEVALHRCECAAALLAVDGRDTVELDGVADRCAGAVGLHHADGGRVDPGAGQGGAEHGDLSVFGRGEDVVGPAVLIGGGGPDHGQHAVAVALGVIESLEHHDTAALGADETVGRDVERMAVPGLREHALAGGRGVQALVQHQHHTAGESHIALPLVQAAAGLVHRDHARRARGVQRQRRPVQTQGVRDAARGHAERVTGERVGLIECAGVTGDHRVVVMRHTDEHTGRATGQR